MNLYKKHIVMVQEGVFMIVNSAVIGRLMEKELEKDLQKI